MKLLKKLLWYSDDQRIILSKNNLNSAIILFCAALSYAIVSIMRVFNNHGQLKINGINMHNYAFIVFTWSLSGLLLSLLLRHNNRLKSLPQKVKIICSNLMMYYNIGFYVVLTHIYMTSASDKVKPLMAFGIIIGIYTLFAYVSPYMLSIIYFSIYILTYFYIKNYIGKAESILGGVYVLLYIIFVFVKSWSARSVYEKRIALEQLNSITSEKYIEQLKLNSEYQKNTIIKLADLIESRDDDTGEHTKRTSELVNMLSKELVKECIYKDKLNDKYIESLTYSSLLHDIGKIKISDTILNAPRKLTIEEFDVMKMHTVYGRDIINNILADDNDYIDKKIASEIALYHHEKWNGKGYPEGLAGEDIPLHARIMAVADVYDALISKRCYKDAYDFEKAFEIIKNDSGTHFDPNIVNALINIKNDVIDISNGKGM